MLLRLGGWGRRLSYDTFGWGCDTRLLEISLQPQIPKLLKTFSRGLGSVLIGVTLAEGGLTEADDAGAPLDHIRSAAAHAS